MSLSPQFLDELRARTVLSVLVGKTVKLAKAGREHKGCCPFHNEKTPSFYVNDEKGFYHCFGCSAHGDAIRWMTDQRGLPFMDAVKELAAAAGMDVPAPDPRATEKAERGNALFDVMAAAQAWFVEQFEGIAGAEARAYCERRGLRPETLKTFGIGFAPDGRGKLKSALARFGNDKLIEAGLLISVDDKEPYDRFRGRLMIPIRDPRGRVIAFGGRILGSGEPKYLNSPDTPLFDKGRTLYNLDRAASSARKKGRLIAVEGYLDVITLNSVGVSETVAPLGTAITETQIARMWQICSSPLLCFDGDQAGQKAMIRAAVRALPGLEPNRTLQFVKLPDGMDPDDLAKGQGAEGVERVLSAAMPLFELIWNSEVIANPLDTPEAQAGLKQRLFEHSSSIRNSDVRSQYQALFSQRLAKLRYGTSLTGKDFLSKNQFASPGSMAAIKRIALIGLDQAAIVPAVIAGLTKFPSLIARYAESLHMIPIVDENLHYIRDALIDIAFENFPIDRECISHTLNQRDMGAAIACLYDRSHLNFSFVSDNCDPVRAESDLAAVIDKLASHCDVQIQIGELRERLKELENWSEALFSEQKRLVDAEYRGMDELRSLLEQSIAES